MPETMDVVRARVMDVGEGSDPFDNDPGAQPQEYPFAALPREGDLIWDEASGEMYKVESVLHRLYISGTADVQVNVVPDS